MKKRYTILAFLLITASTFAQAPEKMSYQAVLRDATNTLLTNQSVGMQISILQTTITGASVYTETQTITTNLNGLVSLEIGTGSTSDNFATIDWSAGPYFIKIETDPTGGSSYTITGTSQIMSVPFAMYAKTSGSSEANATNISQNTTAIIANTLKDGITADQASAITANTLKDGITADQASAITANNAKTGITADQASDITANTAKVGYTEALVSGNTAVAANTVKVGITEAQASAITDNTDKVGITEDQATAITANTLKDGITADQASAITANTLKDGITSAQVSAITANILKIGITEDQVTAITANTAKVGITEAQASAITDNTDKVGITEDQATAITDNTAKDGITEAQATAIADNTDKVGITEDQAKAITDNIAKDGITAAQASAIADNTDKLGITEDQASEITANTLKVDTDATSVNAAGALMDSELTDLVGIKAVTISTLQVIPSEGAFVDGDKTKLDGIETLRVALEARMAELESVTPATVGDRRAGGVVFWVDPTDNTHGLVCAIEDQSAGIQWYNGSYTITGATATAIGTGSANTTAIIANQGAVETAYAAGLARAYRGGGYTDWFLPSKDELNEIYQNMATINSTAAANDGSAFSTNFYWSSTENDFFNAWEQFFNNGGQGTNYKYYTDESVRAVRAF